MTDETRYSRLPTLFVEALIKTTKGILLLKRTHPPLKGYWNLPGGMVEFGEHPKEAIIREVKEETNLSVELGRILGVRQEIHDKACESSYTHRVMICYEAKIIGGTLEINRESDAFDFFKDLPKNVVFDFNQYLRD